MECYRKNIEQLVAFAGLFYTLGLEQKSKDNQ